MNRDPSCRSLKAGIRQTPDSAMRVAPRHFAAGTCAAPFMPAPDHCTAAPAVTPPPARWHTRLSATPLQRAGLAAIAAATLCFTLLAAAVAQAPLALDLSLAAVVQSAIGPAELRAWRWISHLGDGRTLAGLTLVVAAWAIAIGRWPAALGMVAAVAGNGVLNGLLKRAFERRRPSLDLPAEAFHGWSFPSGHASGALVACGMLVYLLWRAGPLRRSGAVALFAAAAAVAAAVGFSRVALGAHHLSDVLAGYASGTAWLGLCMLVLEGRCLRCGGRRHD